MMNFLGLPEKATKYDSSPVVVVPVPLDMTTSYVKGTEKGPAAIIEASHQVEFYDPELGGENWEPGIHTCDAMNLEKENPESAFHKIQKTFQKFFTDKKFPVALGGEHSLSAGCIAAASKFYPDLSILQIDAHADLRSSYEGSPYSHASAMHAAFPFVKKIVGVGIRSVCREEMEFYKRNKNITILFDHERIKDPKWIQKALDGLTDHVYLTIDVDGFRPDVFPATGTPEPGGLSWYEGLDLIRALFQKKKVVAADVVELCPMTSQHASNFAAAKLVYKVIGYRKKY